MCEQPAADDPGIRAEGAGTAARGVGQYQRGQGYHLYANALEEAVTVCRALASLPGVQTASVAGAIRRRLEVVDHLHFVLGTRERHQSSLATEIRRLPTLLDADAHGHTVTGRSPRLAARHHRSVAARGVWRHHGAEDGECGALRRPARLLPGTGTPHVGGRAGATGVSGEDRRSRLSRGSAGLHSAGTSGRTGRNSVGEYRLRRLTMLTQDVAERSVHHSAITDGHSVGCSGTRRHPSWPRRMVGTNRPSLCCASGKSHPIAERTATSFME